MGFKYDINRYLASHGDRVPVKSLAEIIKSGRFHPTVQRRLEQAEQGPENGPDTPACQAETAYRDQVRQAVLKTMDALKLDAFVYPDLEQPAAADRRSRTHRMATTASSSRRRPGSRRSRCRWATRAGRSCRPG